MLPARVDFSAISILIDSIHSSTASASSARFTPSVVVAVVFTLLAWGSAFIVIRGVAPEIGGGALALGRLAVGALALGVLMLVARRWVRPSGREWGLLVLYGVAWFGAYNVTRYRAEGIDSRYGFSGENEQRDEP